MATLSAELNVYKTCLALLDMKGWELSILPGPYEAEDARLDSFVAKKDNTSLIAENPISLLGLVSIHEFHHPHGEEPYWWVIKGKEEKLYDRLQEEALEKSFFEYLSREPQACKVLVQQETQKAKQDPSVGLHERLGVSKKALSLVLELVK